jgi:hypothetical protein
LYLTKVKSKHFVSKSLASIAESIYFGYTDSQLNASIKLLEYNFGDILRLFLGDPVFHDPDNFIISDFFFLVNSLKKNLNVIYNRLFEYSLVYFAVHIDEVLKIQLLLFDENAL